MFGIPVADAIAIVTLFAGLFVAWQGAKKGAAAQKSAPPDGTVSLVGGVFADRLAIERLADTVEKLAGVVGQAVQQQERRAAERQEDLLESLLQEMQAIRGDQTGRRR